MEKETIYQQMLQFRASCQIPQNETEYQALLGSITGRILEAAHPSQRIFLIEASYQKFGRKIKLPTNQNEMESLIFAIFSTMYSFIFSSQMVAMAEHTTLSTSQELLPEAQGLARGAVKPSTSASASASRTVDDIKQRMQFRISQKYPKADKKKIAFGQ